jgi:hypothetical protein
MEPQLLNNFIKCESEKVGFILANAIEEGAKVTRMPDKITIDETINVYRNADNTMSVVLRFTNKTVEKAFEPSKDDLAELAEKKRKELAEIEEQLNERAKE